ncbi:hypothetical protein KY290_034894 [Solanum tuberosum]|uniref:MHD1 domain-containing protein n=1 Tax=Solanum tuberosum TaxID=4113 RepID=A0ABQ7U4J0_SOLTU|nr:hypothetical protein KY290_034894 [Solanum tuberosum]
MLRKFDGREFTGTQCGKLNQEGGNAPGAVSLDDVDLDQVSVDFVLICARKVGECKCELLSNWGGVYGEVAREEENSTELLQRFQRDRRILLNFILSGSLIKKVVMPPGAVSLADVDLDQLVDFVLNCARKGELLELSDSNLFPHMNQLTEPFEELSSLSKSQSLSSTQQQEFNNAAADLVLGLSSFATGKHAYYRTFLLVGSGMIETVSGTLVLRWVNSQLARILNWVDRDIQQERWVPVSPQQRHGSSIVEVYRIVEEFFALEVPMRPGELGSLFRGIDNAFQVYAKTVLDKIANKEDIVPPVPILTRYSRESGIKAFVKKELKDTRIPDVLKSVEIDVAATSTLCVQLRIAFIFFQCSKRRLPRRQWREARQGNRSLPFSFVARRSSKDDAMATKARG